MAGEFTKKNNQIDIYFEVIEVRQKIAILASAPHPDIKALIASLSGNENIAIFRLLPLKPYPLISTLMGKRLFLPTILL